VHFVKNAETVDAVDRYGHHYEQTQIAPLGQFFIAFLTLSNYW
jgi:hypothetical protein